MPSRRSFIKRVTGAAAGLAMGRKFPNANAQRRGGGQGRGGARQVPEASGPVTRREVQVGGRRVRVVDIHVHATVDEVRPVVANTEFARNAGGRALDMQRIQEMDRRGIDVQALSINGYWWYAVKDRGLADRIVRAADAGLAGWCKEHPARFAAMTSPSMQFPDLAAAQVEHAVKDLGHRGARCSEAVASRAARVRRAVPGCPCASFRGLRPRAPSDALWRRYVALHGSLGRLRLSQPSKGIRNPRAKGSLPKMAAEPWDRSLAGVLAQWWHFWGGIRRGTQSV